MCFFTNTYLHIFYIIIETDFFFQSRFSLLMFLDNFFQRKSSEKKTLYKKYDFWNSTVLRCSVEISIQFENNDF